MDRNRRSFLAGLATLAGAATAGRVTAQQAQHVHPVPTTPVKSVIFPDPPDTGVAGVVPVVTPDIPHLRPTMDGNVKVFTLKAEPVRTEFLPGRTVDAWGFNGSVPGPTIEVTQGDRVRIIVENHLPEPFAPHWHGLEVPIGQDGVPGISQAPIPPHGSHTYEFTPDQNGSFFYHSHMPMQELMGMIGWFIVHPKKPHQPKVDRDFGLIFQGWDIKPNNTVPNTLAMEFNWLTINGKAGPATTPLIVKKGERVRLRLVNLSMDHHPIHLHGNTFYVTGTEGGRIKGDLEREPGNTVIVGVAQSRDVEFVASNAGDWMLHCHLPHHMMNQMVSMVGPMHGAGPGSEVKGYPQDMWMPMDAMAGNKPELHGLPKDWTGAMMGMMTLVRVVEPAMFEEIAKLRAEVAR